VIVLLFLLLYGVKSMYESMESYILGGCLTPRPYSIRQHSLNSLTLTAVVIVVVNTSSLIRQRKILAIYREWMSMLTCCRHCVTGVDGDGKFVRGCCNEAVQ